MTLKSFFRIVFLLAVLILSVQLVFWPGSGSAHVEIDVKAGMTARDVATQLMEMRLISSPYPFLVWTRLRNAASLIHVGRYRFSSGRSAFWLLDDLINSRTEKAKFVIPEGYASWQIAERLDDFKLVSADEFKKEVARTSAEGFLFPATYHLDYGLSAPDLVRIFRGQFEKMWNSDFENRTKELGWTRSMAVTMASILEREVRQRSELPFISALYNNRLKKRMKLEADPTVQFSMGFWKSRLTYADYRKVKSPYNTYLNEGLPPGPICNPGVDAIKAALWPAQSDALFMLAQPDGFHSFSTTYRDHVNKINKRNRENRR